MEIQVKFNTWEEMQEFCRMQAHCENAVELRENLKAVAEKPQETAEKPVEAPKVEEPAITLQDVQKAVRELVKAKGKDAAKAVLENYGATSASSVRSEHYKAAIADLKEVLNA